MEQKITEENIKILKKAKLLILITWYFFAKKPVRINKYLTYRNVYFCIVRHISNYVKIDK